MAKVRCTNCDFEGESKKITPGSFLIEVILWLCFIIPGVIYSIWRLASRKTACPVCKWEHVVPLNHPRRAK